MKQIKEFVYGIQYYRAPTPPPDEWEKDLARIRQDRFNCVKYWVQWIWRERNQGEDGLAEGILTYEILYV